MRRWLSPEQARTLLGLRPVASSVALQLIGWGVQEGTLNTLAKLHPVRSAQGPAIKAVLEELVAAELVSVETLDGGRFRVSWSCPKFEHDQVSKLGDPKSGDPGSGSGTEPEKNEPEKNDDPPPVRREVIANANSVRNRRVKDRGGSGGENHQGGRTTVSNRADQLGLPGLPVGTINPRKKPLTPAQERWRLTERLVKLWVKRTGRPPEAARVTPLHVKLVRDRMAEGQLFEDLAMAVAGIAYSPWHREHGKDFFELAVGEGQVEKAKSYWFKNAPVELVRDYEERTGYTPESREADLQELDRAAKVEAAEREQHEKISQGVARLQEARRRQEADQEAEKARWAGVFDDEGESDLEGAEC